MPFNTAVTTAAEMAPMHPTVVVMFLLIVLVLVLLRMVQNAWSMMLARTLAPRRRKRQTKPHARKRSLN
jgi:hypothetical protein